MSATTKNLCKCNDRSNWVVVEYKCNHSAFNGHRFTPSDYSVVICTVCVGSIWRTKAAYVETLKRI